MAPIAPAIKKGPLVIIGAAAACELDDETPEPDPVTVGEDAALVEVLV